ncbi:sensor histidine kinase [Nonomuraea wenchangensis]|uniref:sensor histidine kinase n=2 Tax=Nonomuraea wenchangensis TaxID=568860 RepID=UPI00332FCA5E
MRSRLVALILIPTVVGVLLAGIQLADAIGTSAEYRRLTQVAELAQKVGALNHELAKERTLTAWAVATGNRAGRTLQLKNQRQTTDKAKAQVESAAKAIDDSHTSRVREGVAEMSRWLDGLDSLRESMVGNVPPQASIRTYTTMIGIFSSIQAGLADGVSDDRLQRDIAALGSLQSMKEEVSRQQIMLIVALAERKLDGEALTEFLGSWDKQQAALASFEAEASAEELKAYQQGVRGQQIDRADSMRQRALAQMREYNKIGDLDVTTGRDLTVWYDSTTLTANAMRKVEDNLATKIVTRTRGLSDDEQRNAIISGAMILVLLLLVLVITTRVAGSLVRPLRRLRAEALQVATTRLPETVRVLRESGEGAQVPEVPSIGINTRDEIGEVARAFDEVHREAIRLAGDEAKLRANVNSMFVNLSRRSQTLVERQLQLIEGLEQGEEDEQRLANLFRLDHLATRMRRNSENLLVLAGQEAARKWSEPVPLVDIARASLSEVENYERVQISIASSTLIVGPAVTDAVHLLAELIENAISFSPRESKVTVTSTPAEGGVLITINDQGIGMSQEELGEANWRLANPPVVDVSVSRRMGLFVVGRLALRHGIRVQLSQRENGGLSALVMMPDMLISGGAGVPQQGGQYEAFTSFDPSMFNQPSANGTQSAANQVLDTEWPGSLPAPGSTGTSWPSFGEQPSFDPSASDQPSFDQPPFGQPRFGEQQPAAFGGDRPGPFDHAGFDQPPVATPGGPGVDEQRWPSFAEEPPPAGRQEEQRWYSDETARWPSFAEEPPAPAQQQQQQPQQQPFADNRWPSFAEQPPPLAPGDEPRWPSFSTEPPKEQPDDASRWTSFADPLPRRGLFESVDRPRPAFGPDYVSPFDEDPKPADRYEQNGHSGFGAFSAGNYTSQDMTGPLPVVRNSPLEEQSEEFLPIFSSVGSDWFRRPEPEQIRQRLEPVEDEPEVTAVHPAIPADATAPPPAAPPAPAATPPAASASRASGLPQRRPGASGAGATWSSPADAGFQAAQAAAQPQQSGTTSSGLPRRVPKANLVPGTASLAEPQPTSPPPQISPERLRSRLSSFQQGVRQGRAFTRGENEEDK